MKRLSWRDSATAAAPPRLRVERFCACGKYRVHLLGELRCQKVHFAWNENTRPCEEPNPCSLCLDQRWKARLEYFAPALVMSHEEKLWVPIVAVITAGGFKLLEKYPPGSFRGRLLEVIRETKGSSKILKVRELSRIDPCIPPFDIEPHLLRLWFPTEKELPPAEIPAAVPFAAEEAEARKPIQPLDLPSPEEREKVKELLAKRLNKWHGEQTPAATSPPTSPTAAPPPAPPPPPPPKPQVLNGKSHHAPPGADQPDDESDLRGVLDGIVNRFAPPLGDGTLTIEGDADRALFGQPVARGPKVAIYTPPSAELADEVSKKPTGSIVCGDFKGKKFLSRNGHAAGKGGAR